jgi:hypothetical protein
MRGTISRLLRYSSPSRRCRPGKEFNKLDSFTHQGSFRYPVLMSLISEASGVTDSTRVIGFIPSIFVGWCMVLCTYVGTSFVSGGKHESASATEFSSPGMYCMVKSYCLKNSCQQACRHDSSCWVMKFSRVL